MCLSLIICRLFVHSSWSKKFYVLRIDFRYKTTLPLLIIIASIPQTSFNIKLIALMYVFVNNLSQSMIEDNIMPISSIRYFSAILQRISSFCSSQSDSCYTLVTIIIMNFWILTDIAYKHCLIHSLSRYYLGLFPHTKILELEVLALYRRELTATVNTCLQVINNTIIAVKT